MMREGLEPLYHVKDLSVTGFLEVIKHLSFFTRVMKSVVDECAVQKPDAAILLDYPGFNLRLGVKLKQLGIPVFYYISPQVWAWKKGRVKVMRTFIKRIFVIFPFEVSFYEQQGIPVSFAGHPVVEKNFDLPSRGEFFSRYQLDQKQPVVALLPGSRRNELDRHVQPLLEAVTLLEQARPGIQFVLAGLSSLDTAYYVPFTKHKSIQVILDDPYPLMAHADVAIVASGTATLETAYLGTPLVVFYKIAPLSYLIGRMLVDIEHLAMPNLILGERAIPELIQGDANGQLISEHVVTLLNDDETRNQMRQKLERIKLALGNPGCADMIAHEILEETR